jgi:hypothetical protein
MKVIDFYEKYRIEFIQDNSFSPNSTDNARTYSNCFALDLDSALHHSCKCAISVFNDEDELASAILLGEGGATGIHEKSYFISESMIYLCIGNAVAALSIPNLSLKWIKKADDATAFQILPLQNDIIVHGEMSISRITTGGNLIWRNYGSDIFVTHNGAEEFSICENRIFAESWDGRKYVFDFDGMSS